MPNGQVVSQHPPDGKQLFSAAYKHLLLLDNVTADDPGVWVPAHYFRNGSFEVDSIGTLGATVTLYASNSIVVPSTQQVITIGGTVTAGDVLAVGLFLGASPVDGAAPPMAINYNSQGMNTPSAIPLSSVTVPVVAGDTTATLATKLAAALNQAVFGASGIGGSVAPAPYGYSSNYVNPYLGLLEFTANASQVTISFRNPITDLNIQTIVNGSASTETLTVGSKALSTTGFAVANCALTAVGNVVFNQPAAYLRAAVSNYTSGQISATAYLVCP